MGTAQPGDRPKTTLAPRRQRGKRSGRTPHRLCRARAERWRGCAVCLLALSTLCPTVPGAAESVSLTIRVVVLPPSAFLAVPTLTVLPLPVLDAPLTKVPLARLPAPQGPLQMVLTVASAAASGHPYFTTQTGARCPIALVLMALPSVFRRAARLWWCLLAWAVF
jgi:hypothetical protein